ncbi:MAG: DUF1697 domain-containing protein [Actinomycetota bacterium]|nr:DUF1697 domain-containing protein [Actinomycetota bacterium]
MTTWVALRRAVNLASKRNVPMADLRVVLTYFGCADVVTYIQSGNADLTHASRSAPRLEADLGRALETAFGFEIPVMLRTAKQLGDIVQATPFPKATEEARSARSTNCSNSRRADVGRYGPRLMRKPSLYPALVSALLPKSAVPTK